MEKCVNEIRIWVLKRRFVNWSHGEKWERNVISVFYLFIAEEF